MKHLSNKINITRYRLYLFTLAIAVVALIAINPNRTSGQSKKDLQKQRDQINEQIELTKKLIKDSEKQQKNTTAQVQLLNKQLNYREQLLKNINNDIQDLEGEINTKGSDVEKLKTQVSEMKVEYAKMLRNAYRNRNAYQKMMFIFASDDFNKAYKRLKMTQRYTEIRKQQANKINNKQEEIETEMIVLTETKQSKETLAREKEKEKEKIQDNKTEQQNKLTSLEVEKEKLQAQQKKQKVDRDKLTLKIQEAIAQELEAERKKTEEARKKAAATNTTASNKTNVGTTTTTAAKKTIELAPEVIIANTDFEKNKGALPWPVVAGVITSSFGKHPHPSLAGVEVKNNGVDFITEKNAGALTIFAGTVTSVFNIPGAGQNVIVTHGTYKSVYSGLADVNVKVGDKVALKQKIGTVMFDGEENTLHFEIWKVSAESGAAQNPETWIKRK